MANISINGIATLTDIQSQNSVLRPTDWGKNIVEAKMNNGGVLTILTQLLKKKTKVTDPYFQWLEQEPMTRMLEAAANFTTTDTSITFATKQNLKAREKTLLKVLATGEVMLVTAAPLDDNKLTVQRGFSSGGVGTALNIATQDPRIMVIGNAFEEFSTAPSSYYETPTQKFNYVQTFRATWGYSGTAQATTFRSGFNLPAATKKQALLHFEQDMESAMWFGKRNLTTYNSRALYTMGGIEDQLPATQIINCNGNNVGNIANGLDLTGGLTYSAFEDLMNLIFRYGSKTKMGFATTQTITNLSRMSRLIKGVHTNIDFKANITNFGMNVVSFTTSAGTLVLKANPTWDLAGAYKGFAGLDDQMYILDMDALEKVEHRAPFTQENIQERSADGRIDGILTDMSLKLLTPACHVKLANLKIKSEI